MWFFFLQSTLAILDKLDIDSDKPSEEEIARLFGYEDDYISGRLNWWQKLKPQIWSIFDEPYSSVPANVSIYYVLEITFLIGGIDRYEISTIFYKYLQDKSGGLSSTYSCYFQNNRCIFEEKKCNILKNLPSLRKIGQI